MDGSRAERKKIKKQFRWLGVSLLCQEALLIFVVIVYGIVMIIRAFFTGEASNDAYIDRLIEHLTQSGLPMILAVVIAFIAPLIYRRKKFFTCDLRTTRRKMSLSIFLVGLALTLSVNMVMNYILIPVEWLLNFFGYTAEPSLDVLEGSKTWSMFLYACLIGPVFEEFLYRGIVLRSLEPLGSVFAVITSALIFSLMHGNIIQIPMAFGVGLILGYLALRYSIKLTILIHIANNLSAELFSALHNETWQTIYYIILFGLALIITLAFIYKNRTRVRRMFLKLKSERPEKRLWLYYFTSIPVILLLLSYIFLTILGVERI